MPLTKTKKEKRNVGKTNRENEQHYNLLISFHNKLIILYELQTTISKDTEKKNNKLYKHKTIRIIKLTTATIILTSHMR